MSVEPVIAISAIEHYEYCPRQCALIHVDGVWSDNAHTVRGEVGHRRADAPGDRMQRGARVVRALPLWSERLGLAGRADAVEFLAGGQVVPVEYKIGGRHGDAAHLQLAAQAMCLEEMLGRAVPEGALWFAGPRCRMPVAIDESLRTRTLAVVTNIRRLIEGGALPQAVDDRRCEECQLLGYCLPKLTSTPSTVLDYVRTAILP